MRYFTLSRECMNNDEEGAIMSKHIATSKVIKVSTRIRQTYDCFYHTSENICHVARNVTNMAITYNKSNLPTIFHRREESRNLYSRKMHCPCKFYANNPCENSGHTHMIHWMGIESSTWRLLDQRIGVGPHKERTPIMIPRISKYICYIGMATKKKG